MGVLSEIRQATNFYGDEKNDSTTGLAKAIVSGRIDRISSWISLCSRTVNKQGVYYFQSFFGLNRN